MIRAKPSQKVPDNIIDTEKIGQPLLSISMLLIYGYLIFYVFYEGITEIDDKDEDFVNCICLGKDKAFYIALFGIFSAFWITAVVTWSILGFIDLCSFW